MPQATENIVEKFGPEKIAAGWPKKLFIFSLLVFLIATAVYSGLNIGYRPFLESKIAEKETQIDALTKEVPAEKQKEFVKFYSQLTNLKELLDGHTVASKSFIMLENNTYSDIYYKNMELNVRDQELILEGIAKDSDSLALQLAAFKQDANNIVSYVLKEVRFSEGKLQFQVLLKLSPSLFK